MLNTAEEKDILYQLSQQYKNNPPNAEKIKEIKALREQDFVNNTLLEGEFALELRNLEDKYKLLRIKMCIAGMKKELDILKAPLIKTMDIKK